MMILKMTSFKVPIVTCALLALTTFVSWRMYYSNSIGKSYNPVPDSVGPTIKDFKEPKNLIKITTGTNPHTPAVSQKCSKKPVILLWTPWFNDRWPIPHGNVKCGDMRCEITEDHRRFKNSDAVVFHGASASIRNTGGFPSKSGKPSKQLWVYRNMENPVVTEKLGCKLSSSHNNIFHATMTYRQDADVTLCYGRVQKGPHRDYDPKKDYAAGRSKLIAWVSSQCYPGRTTFVKELSKYVTIDKFGRCGDKQCKRDGSCMRDIKQQYKFYLSFENYICKDYITEKYYRNAINQNLIPIVVGGANYSNPKIVPPHSYIDAQKFPSIQALGQYIKKVAADHKLYNSYFEWKRSYRIDSPCDAIDSFCELCHKLCDDKWVAEKSKKTIPDLTYRWGSNRHSCVDYSDVFQKDSKGKISIHPQVYKDKN